MEGATEGFCRGCLKNFEDPTDLLQYTEESRRLFVYATGLQVKRNEAFPFQLCKECYYSMKTSCKFKKMCRTSDKKIKSYISLRDVDDDSDDLDFSTFLRRNDEAVMFRLPMLSGSSTPADQKAKDDDNESTCTSIQNFMTDILKPEEIPDTEARIIREVIEEEADVLEDSLDSHWLQDDKSNDNDFQLDLSLSRFSTPYSTNNDRMYSSDNREVTSTDITSGEDYDNIFIDSALKKISDPVEDTEELVEETTVLQNVLDVCSKEEANKVRCVIDKNLEKALKDENNKEFSLEVLLASPVLPNTSGASTPTIKRILFGDKELESKKSKSPNFETDLDLLIGKLDKGKPNGGKFQGRFDIGKSNNQTQEEQIELSNEFIKGKLHVGKLESGKFNINAKMQVGKIDLGNLNGAKSEIDKINVEKLLEGNAEVHMEDFNLEQIQESKLESGKLSGGKSYVGQINVEKLLEEKLQVDVGEFNLENIDERKFDLGKLSVGKLNMENLNQEEIQEGKLCLEKLNVGRLHDSKLDLNDMSLELLLDGKSKENNIGKEKDQKFDDTLNINEIQKGTLDKLSNSESQEEDSNAAILEEFLSVGKGKLQNIGIKEKSLDNLDNPAQIDDAELTELLDEAYDQNLVLKGKKSLNVQNENELNLNIQKSYPDKKIVSPMEKKYCITNFYCKMCNKKFRDLRALKIHFVKFHQHKIKTPLKPRTYHIKVCDLCGRTFTSNKSLKHHIKNHEKPTEYSCEKCLLTFKSENALNTHKLTHRKKTSAPKEIKESDSKYVCKICGAVSTSASNHLTHERRHSKTFTIHCEECGKGFYRTTDLVVHMRKHTGEKPFPCLYCEQKFSRRDTLNRHHKLHTGIVSLMLLL
ncbi:uncharacterized protein [Epargyreus clarus]|uniref:uncharacterized protein n=1 Tax=Epargyreus clarus TaxID=520877 RepID=UPI003C2E9F61